VTSNRREFTCTPPGGSLWEGEGKWELPERNESRNHSRKYSRELWEVTSLKIRRAFQQKISLHGKKKSTVQSLDRDHTQRNLTLHFFSRNTPLHTITYKEHTQHPLWKEKKINTLLFLTFTQCVSPPLCPSLLFPVNNTPRPT
jgi:hypothetical protein